MQWMLGFGRVGDLYLLNMELERFIKSQGDLDGACFLYTLVNAVNCLRGLEIQSPDSWQRLIGDVYDPRDFLRNGIGTARIDEFPEIITRLIGDYVTLLDPSCDYSVKCVKIQDKTRMRRRRLVSQNAVLLVDDGEHWYVLVDVDQGQVFAACSGTLYMNPQGYVEAKSPNLGRTYNTSFELGELVLHKGIAYQLACQS